MGQSAALKIAVDTRDDVVGGDHVHAPGKGAHDIGAEPDEILLIAIPNWQDAGAPTTSIAATFQHTHGVDELMRGIRFPVWRFSPSSDHDARTEWKERILGGHRGRQMHEEGHGTENALGVMH